MKCPQCDYENIPGADACEECDTPLSDLSEAQPATEIERSLLRDSIATLEPKTPHVVSPDTPVGEVLQKLVVQSIGCVLVMEGESLVGIFSERDALMRLNVEASQLRDRPVSEFMTADPETLNVDDKIAFALHRMDVGGYRHVPVLGESGAVTGVISIRDILRHITDDLLALEA